MYQTKKTFVKPDTLIYDLIIDNPNILLLIEHLDANPNVADLTITDYCILNNINKEVFILFANLYNGFNKIDISKLQKDDISQIVIFLKNCHKYYLKEKYPEIVNLISELRESHKSKEINLILKFFDEYFDEVREHLEYEDSIVFPYIQNLILNTSNKKANSSFSVDEYREHHTDIEFKLTELNNLLLKHIKISGDIRILRKLVFNLFELEQDLFVHSLIEENVLIPLVKRIEND
jgi:regulator of cell morphogenesis and NO signaling